ncbi:unnamed protein product [Ectocarpus sp. 13 AM-2016]
MGSPSPRTNKGLAIVMGAGWLSFFQLRSLECSCLYVCRESRRQVARRVRVTDGTPRTLWRVDRRITSAETAGSGGHSGAHGDGAGCVGLAWPSKRAAAAAAATSGAGGSGCVGSRITGGGGGAQHKFSWHGRSSSSGGAATGAAVAPAGSTAASRIRVPATGTAAPPGAAASTLPATPTPARGTPVTTSRVPLVKAVGIIWQLPALELLEASFGWPQGVKELHFGAKFDEKVDAVEFPETLEALTFGYWFNESLGPGRVRWPPALKRLKFGAAWNRNLVGAKDTWPASLEVVRFGTSFDKPLRGGGGIGLPPRLREVHLGGVFNQPLDGVEWPASLEKLTLSEYFNQSLGYGNGDGVVFPKGLREVVFGGRFNQAIDDVVWPERLRTLTFGDKFNQAFPSPGIGYTYRARAVGTGGPTNALTDGAGTIPPPPSAAAAVPAAAASPPPPPSFLLPAGLKELVLGDGFNHPLAGGELPDGLEKLVIGQSFSFVSSVRWPAELRRLELSCRWGDARAGSLGGGGSRRQWRPSCCLSLPKRLEYLDTGDGFNSPLDTVSLPASLRVLILGSAFNYPLDHALDHADSGGGGGGNNNNNNPNNPQEEENQAHRGQQQQQQQQQGRGGGSSSRRQQHQQQQQQPSDLDATLALPPLLPGGLEELRLGAAFNRELETARLPERLKRLVFVAESKFDRPVAGVRWPRGLEELRFGNCFDQPMESGTDGFDGFDGFDSGGCGGSGGDGGGGGGGGDPALMLPATLRELHFGWAFSHSLQGLAMPRCLRRLSFFARYPVSHVRGLEWPPSLRCIHVGSFRFGSRKDVAIFFFFAMVSASVPLPVRTRVYDFGIRAQG